MDGGYFFFMPITFVSTYNTVTVTTTATQIMASNPLRKGCLITNTANATIYLGMDSSVTTSTGIPLAANATFNNAGTSDAWRGDIYGIIGSSTADIRFWEWGP